MIPSIIAIIINRNNNNNKNQWLGQSGAPFNYISPAPTVALNTHPWLAPDLPVHLLLTTCIYLNSASKQNQQFVLGDNFPVLSSFYSFFYSVSEAAFSVHSAVGGGMYEKQHVCKSWDLLLKRLFSLQSKRTERSQSVLGVALKAIMIIFIHRRSICISSWVKRYGILMCLGFNYVGIFHTLHFTFCWISQFVI